jgi:hypothetical protein
MQETWKLALEAARNAPRCKANSRRSAFSCQSPAMSNGRCRMHGGKSTGAPCGEGHGKYHNGFNTKQFVERLKYFNQLLRDAKHIIGRLREPI